MAGEQPGFGWERTGDFLQRNERQIQGLPELRKIQDIYFELKLKSYLQTVKNISFWIKNLPVTSR